MACRMTWATRIFSGSGSRVPPGIRHNDGVTATTDAADRARIEATFTSGQSAKITFFGVAN